MPKVLSKKEKLTAEPVPGGGVRIEIGGKKRVLRFDFNALVAVEEETGINALDGEVWGAPTAKVTRAMLWAGLLHEEPTLPIEIVGRWLTLGNINLIGEVLGEAFAAAMSSGEEQSERAEGEEKN